MVRVGFREALLAGLMGVMGCSSDGDGASGSDDSAAADGAGGSNGSTESSGSATSGTTSREVLSCQELETKIEADAAAFDIPTEVTLGSWEGVPRELKVLPEGAELCGSVDVLNQGLIKAELSGAELEAYYRPIFESLDCPSLECTVQTQGDQEQYVCSCFGEDSYGSLTTAPDVAYYLLAYQ